MTINATYVAITKTLKNVPKKDLENIWTLYLILTSYLLNKFSVFTDTTWLGIATQNPGIVQEIDTQKSVSLLLKLKNDIKLK